MLIHGRLILTSHGFMLDEVRSLLQKALRRPQSSRDLALQACKELIGYGKNQLPWKSLITFLFEDHCLADAEVLKKIWLAYTSDSKYDAVALLASCRTCRIAACLPVITVEPGYYPVDFDESIEVPDSLTGLISENGGAIRMGTLLVHIQNAWRVALKVASEGQSGPDKKEIKDLMTYIKLASAAVDHEVRTVTMKGTIYLIEKTKCKATVGLVVLSALYKVTSTEPMRSYLLRCFRLATIPDVCVRLILFCTVTQLMYGSTADKSPVNTDRVDWPSVTQLTSMPDWATDKHTFRGKFGKGTTHLIKQKQEVQWMTEKELAMFHGERPKTGIQHFFDVAAAIECPSVPGNPYWETTKQIYYGYTPRQQKTTQMTKIYIEKLKATCKNVFMRSATEKDQSDAKVKQTEEKPSTSTRASDRKLRAKINRTPNSNSESKPVTKGTLDSYFKKSTTKRKHSDEDVNPLNKKICLVPGGDSSPAKCSPLAGKYTRVGPAPPPADLSEESSDEETETDVKPGTSTEKEPYADANSNCNDPPKESSASSEPSVSHVPTTKPTGPLLQLPTGSGKVYTMYVKEENRVFKGPYRLPRLNLCLFLHKALKVLGDKHVLEVEDRRPYLIFPLLKGRKADMTVTRRTFYDAISKKEIVNGEFIQRENLGIIQLHRLPPEKLRKLPCGIWAHFLYRFLLNVGDSGLYNAVTNADLDFVYGIDIEECRSRDPDSGILNFMFVKPPAKALRGEISGSLKAHKCDLFNMMCKDDKVGAIKNLASTYQVEFDAERFTKRMEKVRDALLNL